MKSPVDASGDMERRFPIAVPGRRPPRRHVSVTIAWRYGDWKSPLHSRADTIAWRYGDWKSPLHSRADTIAWRYGDWKSPLHSRADTIAWRYGDWKSPLHSFSQAADRHRRLKNSAKKPAEKFGQLTKSV